jgi:hypothetical protein
MPIQDRLNAKAFVLTRAEAALMCSISVSTFDVWVRKGIVPGPIVGTRRWSREALERALGVNRARDCADTSPFEKWRRCHAP